MRDRVDKLQNESKFEKAKDAYDETNKFIQSKLKSGGLIISDSECRFSRGGINEVDIKCSFLNESINAKYVLEGHYSENKKNQTNRKHVLFIEDLKDGEEFEGVLRLYSFSTSSRGFEGATGSPSFELYVVIEKAQKAKTTKAESEEKDKSVLTRLKAGDYVSRDQIISELEKYEKNCKGE